MGFHRWVKADNTRGINSSHTHLLSSLLLKSSFIQFEI
jgi:hypothetical protein